METSQETLLVTQSPQLERNGIFEFDLSAIDDAATINSVSILFTLGGVNSSTGGTPAAVDLFTYLGDGVIDIDDFDASGTQVVDTTTAVGLPGTTAGVEISFVFSDLSDVTAALLDDLLTVRFETEPSATLRIASLENPEYAAASLTIDYDTAAQVPLPASLPLVLGGLGVLLG